MNQGKLEENFGVMEYYKVNNTDFYISSGLGVSRYNFRLFNFESKKIRLGSNRIESV